MPAVVARVLVTVLTALAGAFLVVRVAGLDRGLLAAAMTVFPWSLVLAAIGLVIASAVRWRPGMLVSGVILVIGLGLLLPRVVPNRQPPADGPMVTVLVANLREGRGDADVVVSAVREFGVDLLVTPELTDDAIERLTTAGLDDLLDPATLSPSGITSGIGVWSSFPTQVLRERTGGRGFSRENVEVRLTVGDTDVAVTAVHPLPPITADWVGQWEATLADVPDPATDASSLVLGDLNATLDHRALRALLDRGWVDAADASGDAWRTTFNGLPWGEPVPPVTLDHVLVNERVAVREVRVLDLPDSDHRMLAVRLQLP